MTSSYTYTTKHIKEIQNLFEQDLLFIDLCGLFSSKASSLIESSDIKNLRKTIVEKAKSYDSSLQSRNELNSLLEQFKNTATRVASAPNDHHYYTATQNLMKAMDTVFEHVQFDSDYTSFIQAQNQLDRSAMPVTKLVALRALARRKLFLSQTETADTKPFEYKNYEISSLETVASRSLNNSVAEMEQEINALSKDPKNDTQLDTKLANITYESLYESLYQQYTDFLNSKTLHVHKSVSVLGDVANQYRNNVLTALGVGVGVMALQSISAGPMLPFLPGGSWEASWAFFAQQLPWYLLGGSAAGLGGSLLYYNLTNGSSKKLLNNLQNANSLQQKQLLELAKAYKSKKIKFEDIVKDKEIANILGKNKRQQRRALSRLATANDRAEAIIKLPISSLQRANYKLQNDSKVVDKDNKISLKSVDTQTKQNALVNLLEICSDTNPLFIQMGVAKANNNEIVSSKVKVAKKKTPSDTKTVSTTKKAVKAVIQKAVIQKPEISLQPAFARLEEQIKDSKAVFEESKKDFKETLKNRHLTSTEVVLNIEGQEVRVTATKNQFAVSSQMFTSIMKDIQKYAKSSNKGESNFNYTQTTNKKNSIQVKVTKTKK